MDWEPLGQYLFGVSIGIFVGVFWGKHWGKMIGKRELYLKAKRVLEQEGKSPTVP